MAKCGNTSDISINRPQTDNSLCKKAKFLPEPVEMLAKEQKQFGGNVEKRVADLAAPGRNKAKKLLKRYTCTFATNNKRQERTGRC